jgi:hypothetical protein
VKPAVHSCDLGAGLRFEFSPGRLPVFDVVADRAAEGLCQPCPSRVRRPPFRRLVGAICPDARAWPSPFPDTVSRTICKRVSRSSRRVSAPPFDCCSHIKPVFHKKKPAAEFCTAFPYAEGVPRCGTCFQSGVFPSAGQHHHRTVNEVRNAGAFGGVDQIDPRRVSASTPDS